MEKEKKLKSIDSSILYRCNHKYYDKALDEYGLGYTQLSLLLTIYENEGVSMNELAILGSYDKGTITKAIQKLEQSDLVRVENSTVDKRSKMLYTGEKATKIIPKLYLIRQEWNDYLSEEINDSDLKTYYSVLEKMIDKAREYNRHESEELSIRIYGLQKLTLLDYPGYMAATIFTGGCNFRCPFCHNRSLVFLNENDGEINKNVILDYLNNRKGMLDGVCISGGEPLLHEGLEDFIKTIKETTGLKVKLDTNGSQFDKLKNLVEKGLVDYVALDIKNSKSRYAMTIGLDEYDIKEIEKCVNYLKEGHVDYEFRTTVVKEFHEETNFKEIGKWLKGAKCYFLQNFEEQETCIKKGLHPLEYDKLKEIRDVLKPYIENVEIRGK